MVTRTACRLLAFASTDFHRLVEENPLLRERLTDALVQRLRQVSNTWIRLAADTDLLLDACLALQDHGPMNREEAIEHAVAILRQVSEKGSVRADDLLALTPAERHTLASLLARLDAEPGPRRPPTMGA